MLARVHEMSHMKIYLTYCQCPFLKGLPACPQKPASVHWGPPLPAPQNLKGPPEQTLTGWPSAVSLVVINVFKVPVQMLVLVEWGMWRVLRVVSANIIDWLVLHKAVLVVFPCDESGNTMPVPFEIREN